MHFVAFWLLCSSSMGKFFSATSDAVSAPTPVWEMGLIVILDFLRARLQRILELLDSSFAKLLLHLHLLVFRCMHFSMMISKCRAYGLITCASSIGALFMRTVAKQMLRWWGFRNVLVWNGMITGLYQASSS